MKDGGMEKIRRYCSVLVFQNPMTGPAETLNKTSLGGTFKYYELFELDRDLGEDIKLTKDVYFEKFYIYLTHPQLPQVVRKEFFLRNEEVPDDQGGDLYFSLSDLKIDLEHCHKEGVTHR